MKQWSKKAIQATIDTINNSTPFCACGIIKETLPLWRAKENYNQLNDMGKMIADHYLKEAAETVQ